MGNLPKTLEPKWGLYISNHKLVWGVNSGWGIWLLFWIKHIMVCVWNHVACFIYGHNDILWHIQVDVEKEGGYHCVDCCKTLYKCWCRKKDNLINDKKD